MTLASAITRPWLRKPQDTSPLRISADVFQQIRTTIGSLPAETGGMLGGSFEDGVIREYQFDGTADTTACSYTPDVDRLNELLLKWNAKGIRLMGFVHSHPRSINHPSSADEEYAVDVLRDNLELAERVGHLFLPIVFPQIEGHEFEIFPHVAIISRWERVSVHPCDLEVIHDTVESKCAQNAIPASTETVAECSVFDLPDCTHRPIVTFPASPAFLNETFARVASAHDISRLSTARIIAVGVGGAGAAIADLARAGVGEIVLIDHDVVSLSNLATQSFPRSAVGRSKVECLADQIRHFNPLAVVVPRQARIEEIDDAEFSRLAFGPMRTWMVTGRSFWGMLGNDVPIEAAVCPSRSLLIGTTDSFFAQAHINRLALRFGLPSLCSQIYANGRAAEVTYTFPGITPACHRCMLESRYKAYFEEGFQNDVTPHGCPLSSITRINSLCEFVALALLHVGTGHPRWGSIIERLGNRNLIQVRMDPDVELEVFDRVFSRADRQRIFSDESVWLPQLPNAGGDGRPTCPDCGGTGDLRHAQVTHSH